MSRIAIYSHSASDSVNALSQEFLDRRVAHLKLRREGSLYTPRSTDILFNYGSRNSEVSRIIGLSNARSSRVLNTAEAVNNAANKVNAFNRMRESSVSTVEFTTETRLAREWVSQGHPVYARTVLNGHSGEGIVIIDNIESFVEAPLYTKGIAQQRREFRVHVMNGTIIYVQQKKRREGATELPEYSERIRNHQTGWIYATSDIQPNNACLANAVQAVNALGLDFGAVDIITRHDNAWVLEVNTAPGLSGTTLTTYADNLINLVNNNPVTPWRVQQNEPTVSTSQQDTVSNVQQTPPVSNSVTEPVVQRSAQVQEQQPTTRTTTPPVRLRNGSWYIVSATLTPTVREVVLYSGEAFWGSGVEVPMTPSDFIVHSAVNLQ